MCTKFHYTIFQILWISTQGTYSQLWNYWAPSGHWTIIIVNIEEFKNSLLLRKQILIVFAYKNMGKNYFNFLKIFFLHFFFTAFKTWWSSLTKYKVVHVKFLCHWAKPKSFLTSGEIR